MKAYFNSKLIQENDVFICQKSAEKFITCEIINKVSKIFVEIDFYKRNSNFKKTEKIQEIENFYEDVKYFLKTIYNIPEKILGITGTKGKTSTCWYVFQLLSFLSKNCGYIGTLGYCFSKNGIISNFIKLENQLTTPDIDDIYKILSFFKEKNVDYVVIEISSHALSQNRVATFNFETIGITNITKDHLEFHKTIDEYIKAKFLIFSKNYNVKHAVLFDQLLKDNILQQNSYKNLEFFGKSEDCEYKILEIKYENNFTYCNLLFQNNQYSFQTEIISESQIQNIILAIAMLIKNNFAIEDILNHVQKLKPIAGRMERFYYKNKPTNILIDYAHNAFSLFTILFEFKKQNSSLKIATIFGCGGDRDKTRRPTMTYVALRLSYYVILTVDNLRSESFQGIVDEMLCGVPSKFDISKYNLQDQEIILNEIEEYEDKIKNQLKIEKNYVANYHINENRENAIYEIIQDYEKYDIIFLFCKGHENYIIIGDEKIPYSDFVSCQKAFDSLSNLDN